MASSNVNSFIADLKRFRDNNITNIGTVLDQATLSGVNAGRTKIETSTTRRGENRARAGLGEPGRIETGKMLGDFGTERERTRNVMRARVGWVQGREDYYLIQEYGGQVEFGYVEPMHAIVGTDRSAMFMAVTSLKDGLSRLGFEETF